MSLAFRELVRQPSRFAAATVTLILVAVLLMFLGALLDGLVRSATGAVRAQHADAFVFSVDSRASFLRSRVDGTLRDDVERLGVGEVGGLDIVQLGVRLPGSQPRDVVSVAVIGYELETDSLPAAPSPGHAIADRGLAANGVRLGDTLLVGPERTPVVVDGWVSDTAYDGQPGVWVEPSTWTEIVSRNRPQALLAADANQALIVRGGSDDAVRQQLRNLVGSRAMILSESETIAEIPGVSAQKSTFASIIGVTLVVALVVVALFFALITIERLPLFGALKAIGASSAALIRGVVLQAVLVSATASLVAVGVTVLVAALLPAGTIPIHVSPGRVVISAVSVLAASVLGSLFSLRRIVRSSPASALGGGW